MLKIYLAAYGGVASDSKKTCRKPGVGREQLTYRGLVNLALSAQYRDLLSGIILYLIQNGYLVIKCEIK